MPNYKGHLVGGAVTFAAIIVLMRWYSCPWLKLAEWLAAMLAGALFPDIDVHSKGQKIFYRLLLLSLLVLLYQQKIMTFVILGTLAAVPLVVQHRGIFHHPWFIIACSFIPVMVVHWYWPGYAKIVSADALFFCAGAFSHLILDRGVLRVLKQLVRIF